MADVNITVDGKKVTAPQGTLLIEACKRVGIEIPSFCYYPGLSLQGACRMCLVKVEKMPKLQTACTTVISEGMIVTTESDEIKQARKAMLEFVLQNHPLDCPVCDAGGECELQDMTFSYGAAESMLIDPKNHRDEQQWSPVVYFDRPRCILCYRCVRVCGEGMDVWALGIQQRGSSSIIAPNKEDHLECEECGMCIDICPVGALTSGAYRYKTRPWEMNHVGTICTHCGDGCKTTLGLRRHETGMEIVRGDNRDKSGINGDFLCIKGRYAFDFANHPERLTVPLIRRDGKLVPTTWENALEIVGKNFREIRDTHGGRAIGVIGSPRITNEENYLLQKFARLALKTNNIDHHRTADLPAFAAALSAKPEATASMRDVFNAPAVLLIGNDPTEQHPLLAWQIRSAVRLRRARLYVVNSRIIKLRRQAILYAQVAEENGESAFVEFLARNEPAPTSLATGETTSAILEKLRDALRNENDLVVAFGSELRGNNIAELVSALPHAKFVCLADYVNSRGAADMGVYPDLLPGYVPVSQGGHFREEWPELPAEPGFDFQQMVEAAKNGDLRAMYIVSANILGAHKVDPFIMQKPFLVVQDMFLTDTAAVADVVLPVQNIYEKAGTVTNTCGDLQLVRKAGDFVEAKPDLEIMIRIAERMGIAPQSLVPFSPRGVHADIGQSRGAESGEADRHMVYLRSHGLEPKLSPFDPMALLDEIQRLVPGYEVSRLELLAGNDVHTLLSRSGPGAAHDPNHIHPADDTLFTSSTLGKYSKTLNSIIEKREGVSHSEVAAD